MLDPEVDADALRWWVHHQYDRCDPAGWVIASTLPSGGGAWREYVDAFTVADRLGAIDKLAELARRGDLYLTCCPRVERPGRRQRGGAGSVGTLPGFWADIDVAGPRHKAAPEALPPTEADALAVAHEVGLPPSLVLYSGGGLQVWWLLAEPLQVDDENRPGVTRLVAGWGRTMANVGAVKGWHVDNVGDLPRVLRPAGSINHKIGNGTHPLAPLAVEVAEGSDVPPRYNLVDLAALIVPEERNHRPPKRPPEHRTSPPPGVPDGPAELVAALPWWQLFTPLGWEFVRMANIAPHGMAEQWRRPGAISSHSGNFWDGYGVIHSGAAGVGRTGKAMSKFAVYAELYHGGDLAAAGRAVYAEALNRWGMAR